MLLVEMSLRLERIGCSWLNGLVATHPPQRRGGKAEPAFERAAQMWGVCKTGDVRGLGHRSSSQNRARRALHAEPGQVRAQRKADGFGKDMHQSAGRQAH